jgi:molecular chaperone DnaK
LILTIPSLPLTIFHFAFFILYYNLYFSLNDKLKCFLAEESHMSKIVGIDLGTTNSSVAVVMDGKPQIIPDEYSQKLVPSVVGISPEGELLAGQAAKNQYILYPEQTVKSIKRKMGTDYEVELAGKRYKPQEISAFILRKLKKMAEDFLGEAVEKAVITVPAYFSDAQRQATKDAGEIAGLEVVRIINEPTAAALAYGADRGEDGLFLVYDLGGGTFDVSIVEIQHGVIEVRATHGNNHLGGDDFDQKIAETLLTTFKEDTSLDLSGDLKAMARLNRAAENAKITLSARPLTPITEEFLAQKGIRARHLDVEFSRAEFNDLIEEMVNSTVDLLRNAVVDAGIKVGDLSKVLLVGGSTRIPLVQEVVETATSKPPHGEINPEEVVALGAAMQAAIIAGEPIETILVDVTPFSLGIEVVDFSLGRFFPDRYSVIIKRNTPIPVSKSEIYSTLFPEQKKVHVNVYQGENRVASLNRLLGDFMIEGFKPDKDGSTPAFIVTFDFDINGILNVTARNKQSGKEEKITIQASKERLTEEEKEEAKTRVDTFDDKETTRTEQLLEKARLLVNETEDEKTTDSLRKLIASIEESRQTAPEKVEELLEELMDAMYEAEE